jgi:UDP-N-acetyl-alpha-D-quinovosamine dehydrogenase
MKRVLITGANGFVGPWACRAFRAAGWHVAGAVRTPVPREQIGADEVIVIGDLADSAMANALADTDCVVHLAARAHRLNETAASPLDEYLSVNLAGTRRISQAARDAGVRRLVYVSSVKVLGEERERPYTECDRPAPSTPYGVSKLEGERAVLAATEGSTMCPVIVRPPMVYGPRGRGNVPRLVRLARMGMQVPLPVRAIRNRRSFLFVGNLADALVTCASHENAAGETFLVSDGEDVSTPDLLARIARHLGGRFRAFGVSPAVLRALARSVGRQEEATRLLDSLSVDTSRVESRLGWSRPFTLDAGIRDLVLGS